MKLVIILIELINFIVGLKDRFISNVNEDPIKEVENLKINKALKFIRRGAPKAQLDPKIKPTGTRLIILSG